MTLHTIYRRTSIYLHRLAVGLLLLNMTLDALHFDVPEVQAVVGLAVIELRHPRVPFSCNVAIRAVLFRVLVPELAPVRVFGVVALKALVGGIREPGRRL